MDKLKLFEVTFNKLSDDPSYLAYYLKRLMILEHKTQEELIGLTGGSPEDYYKLALCKAPLPGEPDFAKRLKNIAAYTSTSEIILSNIITLTAGKAPVQTHTPGFMAETWAVFRKIVPSWVYQPLLTALAVVLFVAPVFTHAHDAKNVQGYLGEFIHYTDSVKHLQLPDKTAVSKNL
ncbi:MAG: hypothetical protein V4635_01845 [Bacteroidota bacterium]